MEQSSATGIRTEADRDSRSKDVPSLSLLEAPWRRSAELMIGCMIRHDVFDRNLIETSEGRRYAENRLEYIARR